MLKPDLSPAILCISDPNLICDISFFYKFRRIYKFVTIKQGSKIYICNSLIWPEMWFILSLSLLRPNLYLNNNLLSRLYNMNILITGISRCLGKEIANQYAADGHTVFGISRSSSIKKEREYRLYEHPTNQIGKNKGTK